MTHHLPFRAWLVAFIACGVAAWAIESFVS